MNANSAGREKHQCIICNVESRNILSNFKFASLVGIVALLSCQSLVVAQEDSVMEELVVTGIRASLQKALDIKHDAQGIVDVITAEDIGKFPDQNLAEALQRVTGVTISRSRGEGSDVAIRGLGAGFVKTTLNGRNLISGSGSRAFNFNILASDYVSSLEVHKTARADLIEGGIGGVIDTKTTMPLSISEMRLSGSARVGYSELSDEYDPELSFFYANKFKDNSMGVALAGTYQERTLREDQYSASGFASSTFAPTVGAPLVDVATPTSSNFHHINLERERIGLTGIFQWQPDDSMDIAVDFLYSKLFQDEEQASLFSQISARRTNVDVDNIVVNGNNTVTRFGGDWQTRLMDRRFEFEDEVLVFGVNASKELDLWLFELDVSYASGKRITDQGQAISQPNIATVYDSQSGNAVPDLIYGSEINDPSAMTFRNFFFSQSESKSRDYSFKFDAVRSLDGDFITSVKSGLRYASRQNKANASALPFFPNGNVTANWPTIASVANRSFPVNDFLSSTSGNFPRSWVLPDYEAWYAATNAANEPLVDSLPSRFTIEEDTLAVYLMATFQFEMEVPISGDIGVRVVNTDQTSNGFGASAVAEDPNNGYFQATGTFPQLTTRDYTEVLPSLNMRADFSDKLVGRFSAAKVLTRPNFPDLSPRINVVGFSRTGSAGNPLLEPFTANQYDLSLEWYFAEAGSIALAIFYKKLDSFISRAVAVEVFPVDNPGTGPTSIAYDVTRPVNGEGANISGYELAYQQAFDFLPAPFDGTGIIINYTYAKSSSEFANQISGNTYSLEGLAEDSFNVVAYYDKDKISARVAYNYRGEFLFQSISSRNNTLITDEYGQWDANISYEINDHVSIKMEGINLTDEANERYYDINERTELYAETGRRILMGINVKY